MKSIDPPAVVREAVDLESIAAEINAAHERGEASTRAGLEDFRAAGEALIRAKKAVGHGNWLAWLKENVRASYRTTSRYMAVAKAWVKLDTVSNLTHALRLLAEDEPEGIEEPSSEDEPPASDDIVLSSEDSPSEEDAPEDTGTDESSDADDSGLDTSILCRPCRVGTPKKNCPECKRLREAKAADPKEAVREEIRLQSGKIESFCRKVMQTAEADMPDDPWLARDGRRNGAMQKIKDACGTLRTAKCSEVCPVCEGAKEVKGKPCRPCLGTGRMPKSVYDQAV